MCRELHVIDESIFKDPFIECGHCEKCSKCSKWHDERRKAFENIEIQKEIDEERERLRQEAITLEAKQKQDETKALKEDILRLKIVLSSLIQQLNSKGLGIKII